MDITVSFPGGKRVNASFRDHVVESDQPVEFGGKDEAAAPYELFLASLATCAGVYVLGFCQNRGISTEGIQVIQRNEFDPETHRVSHVRLDIEVPPEFPQKYLPALVRVANKCAVKKSLESPPEFSVQTVTKALAE